MIHRFHLQNPFYEDIKEGRKTFFHASAGPQVGDEIKFQLWSPPMGDSKYGTAHYPTIQDPIIWVRIAYVLSGTKNGICDNFVCLGFNIEKFQAGNDSESSVRYWKPGDTP